ncbi:hypothetical protein [Rhodopseudomonas palustris]|uniref:hypothetical protein n=1 Tax=Rhodopseudomonas palustris TaxID=1076 RepID=UPI0014037494|nr:hypothetical protein [Rhodopseudomonas palustris]
MDHVEPADVPQQKQSGTEQAARGVNRDAAGHQAPMIGESGDVTAARAQSEAFDRGIRRRGGDHRGAEDAGRATRRRVEAAQNS